MKLPRFIFILFIPVILLSQDNLDSLFLLGPQKDWKPSLSKQYYQWAENHFHKPTAGSLRQNAIMNGNKITTEIWNYGSISSPGNTITDIVWEGLGYGYEFGPFVAAEVEVPPGSHQDVIRIDDNGTIRYVVHVISDGLISNGGEVSPDRTQRWGWQPLSIADDGSVEYVDLNQNYIPTSDDKDRDGDGKPDSWPLSWYNENLRNYVWPGALGQGATNADKESFFVMDDRDNREFKYYPYDSDTTRRGLGLEVEARYYQWSNVEAEDAIFLIYKIRNKSDHDLSSVIFGMWGDPHIGGPNDWRDDQASFDKKVEMTFAWDEDNFSVDNPNIIPGYLGYKFLESPGLANDGIDNDGDGMVDESWTDGIDNDNDWNVEVDDVGLDGIPNTGDTGENDGVPTAGDPFDIRKPGEPNFEFTDIDESDMIGLTSYAQPPFTGGIRISEDETVWREHIQPGFFDTTLSVGDNVFLYGSGKFTLKSEKKVSHSELSEAIKRFSIALILGADRNDLILNANTVQKIYNSGYQFSKPPAKPHLSVVPGDRRVILYWDDLAEYSVDPVSKKNDFEGYVIYRSTDPGFLDAQTITDVNGNNYLFSPLKTSRGATARFDLDNDYSGPSAVPYAGRGVSYYLGDNTGLRHTFIDSNNVINGQTYFYAVVSYDHGDDSLAIPPSECSKIVTFDPTTNEYTFDVNTARVVPRRRAAGFSSPFVVNQDIDNGIVREEGYSTGTITVDIVDELAVEDDDKYLVQFHRKDNKTMYDVEDTKSIDETFISFYETQVKLTYPNLKGSSVVITNMDKSVVYEAGVDYEIDAIGGSVKVYDPVYHPGARMDDRTQYRVRYTRFPIFESIRIDSEESNPVFDGLRLVIKESSFGIDQELTGWSSSTHTNLENTVLDYKKNDPNDYEIVFTTAISDTSINDVATNFSIFNAITKEKVAFAVAENTVDFVWGPGDIIFILKGGITFQDIAWEIQFKRPAANYTPPVTGDLFYIATDKPFAEGDVFSFSTASAYIDNTLAKSQLDQICVVPNPYVATNVIEPMNTVNRGQRGYRRLYFDHLPARCTIRIYTMTGELVRLLEHNTGIDDGKEFWDLLSKDNMEVAYGLYFFHVDAPGIGEKIGKFAIIK